MPIKIHKSGERGSSDLGWVQSRFSFSFADYYNPERMGFGALRVLNDDVISPDSGFDTHPHSNMEIVTTPLKGELEHKDSMGNSGTIHEGELQRMSAGTGILHSERNPSKTVPAELLQIWVLPKKMNITPSYEQKKFSEKEMQNVLLTVVCGEKKKGTLSINQDAVFLLGSFSKGRGAPYSVSGKNKGVFIFVIEGKVEVLGEALSRRDCAEIRGEKKIKLNAIEKSKVLVIEVPLQ